MSIETLKQALEVLLDSIDDVRDCLNQNLPHAGYARYDRRIEAYREQIAKHEKAIADLTVGIEQAEKQKPVGYFARCNDGVWRQFTKDTPSAKPLYDTTPPAAPVQEPHDSLLNFICHLIDNEEGETISEEGLQRSLADFLTAHTTPPAAQPAPVKVWDAEGYDALMQHMEILRANNRQLTALVRAQQITIEKLEAAQPAPVQEQRCKTEACVHENCVGEPCRSCTNSSNFLPWDEPPAAPVQKGN